MDRVVREALDLGEASLIETALTPSSSGIFMPLEDAKDLKNSLLSVSEQILGSPSTPSASPVTPVSVDLPVAAPLATDKASLLETKSFTELLEANEDALAAEMRIINQKKQQLLKDRQEEMKLLAKVDDMANDVVNTESVLEDKKTVDPVQSFLDLASEAEKVDTEAPAAEAEAETEAETEESSFVELESAVVPNADATLAAALSRGEEISAEAEILEPTFTEQMESESEQFDIPSLSFMMTNEELNAQLDDLAKSKQ